MCTISRWTRLHVIAIAALVLGGCAFGSKMSFNKTEVIVPPVSEEVVVAVWDARPYVLSGDKTPQWVGLQRAGFGIPYGVHTSSGAPLRKEFSDAVVSSFTKAGSVARGVDVPDRTPDAASVARFVPSTGKTVLLEVAQWKTDTMVDVNFAYDLRLSVWNNGKQIAEERIKGDEKLDGSTWNPIGASERVAVAKQKEKLDQLFAKPAVRSALQRGSSSAESVRTSSHKGGVKGSTTSRP